MTRRRNVQSFLTLTFLTVALAVVVHPQSTQPLTFEVASIKVNRSGQGMTIFNISPGGRLNVVNTTVRDLLRWAYQIQEFQLEEGPDWIRSERYDILAKSEVEFMPPSVPLPGEAPRTEFTMMRSLLADRFKLSLRFETKTAPVYDLVLARADRKLGPQLTESNVDCAAYRAARRAAAPPRGPLPLPPPPPGAGEKVTCGSRGGPGDLTIGAMPLSLLVTNLSRVVNRPVRDRTELTGNYDVTLEFAPDHMPVNPDAADAAPPASDRPSIFAALQEQLGLKLEPARGAVEFIVIDYVERPTEN